MNDAELWQRVQDALDRRGDPLDDPELQAAIGATAARIERFATLRGRLSALARPAPRRRPVRAGAVAAALVLALALLATWSRPAAPPASAVRPAPARSALLALTCQWDEGGGPVVEYRRDCAHGQRVETWSASAPAGRAATDPVPAVRMITTEGVER